MCVSAYLYGRNIAVRRLSITRQWSTRHGIKKKHILFQRHNIDLNYPTVFRLIYILKEFYNFCVKYLICISLSAQRFFCSSIDEHFLIKCLSRFQINIYWQSEQAFFVFVLSRRVQLGLTSIVASRSSNLLSQR